MSTAAHLGQAAVWASIGAYLLYHATYWGVTHLLRDRDTDRRPLSTSSRAE